MINFGPVPANSVLPIFFDSYAGSTGASSTISGLAVTDIEIYKGTSMTQRSSDAGYTLLDTDGIDLDGITGINGFSVDLSDNTDAGFYAAGSFYNVVVSAITVDSQTVNFIAATFRIVAAENTAGTPAVDAVRWNNLATVALPLIPTTAGRTLDVSATGEAGVDWANIGSPTTTVALTGTTIAATQKVDVDTIKTNPVVNGGTITFPTNATVATTTGAVGSVTGAVGSVTGAVGSVTGAVGSVTGAVGSVTGSVGGNVTGSVGSVATGGITAGSFAAGAIDSASLASSGKNAIADSLLDRADAIEVGLTPRNQMKLVGAACAGKASGLATTTAVYRNAVADSKDRISATVDANGNRTAVTVDLT
jgi:hypothetical protein